VELYFKTGSKNEVQILKHFIIDESRVLLEILCNLSSKSSNSV